MAGKVLEVSDSAFDAEVGHSDKPVLVDFWAPWCGPCLRVGPIVEGLANEYDGKLKVVKINVDDSPGVASNFAIQSIPTLMIFKGGDVVDRIIGAVPADTLRKAIDKHLQA